MATYIAYRGITTTERVQAVLVGFQMLVLLLFIVAAIVAPARPPDRLRVDWFNPFTDLTLTAFVAGVIGSIFAFWGWDTCLTVNEESKDADKTPGRAAIVTVGIILATYLLVAIAAMMYAGVGTEGMGLGNEENLGQRVRRAGRAGAGPVGGAAAVPGRARVQRGQPADHLPAAGPHPAGHGQLPGHSRASSPRCTRAS